MIELLKSIKNLYDIKFRQPQKISMSKIEKVKSELEKKVDDIKPLSKFDLGKFVLQWKSGDRNFKPREIKYLPFIIHDSRLLINDAAEILRIWTFQRRDI